jgi:hypothetical protein
LQVTLVSEVLGIEVKPRVGDIKRPVKKRSMAIEDYEKLLAAWQVQDTRRQTEKALLFQAWAEMQGAVPAPVAYRASSQAEVLNRQELINALKSKLCLQEAVFSIRLLGTLDERVSQQLWAQVWVLGMLHFRSFCQMLMQNAFFHCVFACDIAVGVWHVCQAGQSC